MGEMGKIFWCFCSVKRLLGIDIIVIFKMLEKIIGRM